MCLHVHSSGKSLPSALLGVMDGHVMGFIDVQRGVCGCGGVSVWWMCEGSEGCSGVAVKVRYVQGEKTSFPQENYYTMKGYVHHNETPVVWTPLHVV